MTASSKTPVATRKAAMEARLAVLTNRLAAIEVELDSHNDPDWEELAVEREGDEVLEATGVSGQQEIRMVKAALSRISDGSYGFCTKCGAKIGEARLDAVPFTPFCQPCATSVGRKGG